MMFEVVATPITSADVGVAFSTVIAMVVGLAATLCEWRVRRKGE